MARQLNLFGGTKRRRGAKRGRKPRADRVGFVPHVARPFHESAHPVHVTMKRVALAPSLQAQTVHAAIVRELALVKAFGVRVVHYSVRSDHLHLMVESDDRAALSRQMQRLFSRIARAVNRVAGRRGSLFRDRHHRHELRTPTETRRALVYILFNTRKHSPSYRLMDGYGSTRWFRGWAPDRAPDDRDLADIGRDAPVSQPMTWLAAVGWRRAGGLIRFDELPHRWPE